ncbi:MAG TPA: hypothetical protein VGR16_10410 [Thermomicrobiales bacterium]|nr:hypothetical protein [Thermomicrobiales bacterium]
MSKFRRQWITPTAIPVGVVIVLGALIILIGEALLQNSDHHLPQESPERLELWIGGGLAIAVIALGAFVASRPRSSTGILDRDVVIGDRPMFAPEPPPVDVRLRSGPLGTTADIGEGYTLYARNGELARVLGVVPGSEEFGRRFQGFIYAEGLHGASSELWVPFEAVMSVYPETKSAFLAIKGDETEHFGWNRMPSSMRRDPQATALPGSPG